MMIEKFDLLSTVEYGGCSAKIPAGALTELLSTIPLLSNANVMVDIQTHDDAGVYKLNETTALIVTTDFFPPICSDAFEFGEIAAANSLSDVYAMGGTPLLALNLNMFPSKTIPMTVLRDILAGGQSKINESGAITMGGHTIEDTPPKYGLAVVGIVSPDRVITNSGAKAGQKIILTKALGSGVLVAAQRMNMSDAHAYRTAIEQMKTLNDTGSQLMQKYDVGGATDITGFGLLGHAYKMAEASGVSMRIHADNIPALPQVTDLLDEGCIPGAAFRNLDFVKNNVQFSPQLTVAQKMLSCDAQTSGGLFICVDTDKSEAMLNDLRACGKYPFATIIGEIIKKSKMSIYME